LPEIVELTLENPAYGGETIGRLPDGRAVFVPFALPGETVRIKIVEERKKYARAELLAVRESSPSRVKPRCQHFGVCGGCHYQHVPYEQQLVMKQRILQDQLERIGHLTNPPIADVVPSPNIYNYRNYVQFHLSAQGKPGFIKANKRGVLEINECHLPQGPLNEIWPLFEIEPQTGISTVGIRLGMGDDILLTLESSQEFKAELNVESLPVSVVHTNPDNMQVLAGSEFTIMRVKERDFRVSALSFFQVNSSIIEKMVETIQDLIPLDTKLLLELYAGVGLFSAFITSQVEKLIAVEASQIASEDFVLNLDEFDNVDLYQGSVEEILPLLEFNPDVVVMDPPRAGLGKKNLAQILSLAPDHILYISCDPATLARDARVISEGGFMPIKFIPFDVFSQTFHIETLSYWIRK
jgi:23S rRNA (uracil1939-C5)-methyltransferase